MAAKNTVSLRQDHEHRKVSLSLPEQQIVENVNLVWYAPDVYMPVHAHDVAQFSTLLTGQSMQTLGSTLMDQQRHIAEFKPQGFNHSNRIGPHGALLLSININAANEEFYREFGSPGWHLSSSDLANELWTLLRNIALRPNEHTDTDLEELVLGLLSHAKPYKGKVLKSPAWLKLATEALNESDLRIGDIAKSVGVHRVHLCRVFQAHFGISVSQYRQALAVQKGLNALLCKRGSIACAGDFAGFADQSHFTRMVRQHLGITPQQFKTLFGCYSA